MTFLLERDLVCRVAGVEQPVPHRQEEAAVVGSVHGAAGMVSVVLEAGVDDTIVRRDKAVLVPTVKVNTVTVEEQTISKYFSQTQSVFVLFHPLTHWMNRRSMLMGIKIGIIRRGEARNI